jgi:hypothetical protein
MPEDLAHNSSVTDTPSNGHRPTAPPTTPNPPEMATGPSLDPQSAMPIPELAADDDLTDALAAFGSVDLVPAPTAPAPAPPQPALPVTDEDRNRFGLLLDHAAERGLLDPHEYEVRLGELASATSVEEMQRIVTELPMLVAPLSASSSAKRRGLGRPAPSTGAWSGATPRKARSSPWLVLVVLVVVLAAALVFFAVYAGYIAHTPRSGLHLQTSRGVLVSALGS